MSGGFRISEQLLLPWSPRATVSTSHVARLLDVSEPTVLRLIEDGSIKAYKARQKPNSPWRINYDSVVAYIELIHKDNSLEQRF
jgi:excisionase family DNA binding protein